MHSGQLHTSFKHLLGPVVQYKDIQTSLVFLLRRVTFKPGKWNSVLGQHSLVSLNQFRVDIEGYYYVQFDSNKGSTALSLHLNSITAAKSQ